MTDNPYSAPETGLAILPRSLAAKKIRFIAFVLRLVGWVFFVVLLPVTGMICFLVIRAIYVGWRAGLLPAVIEKLSDSAGAFLICFICLLISICYIWIGYALVSARPYAYRAAMVLSCLFFVFFFPATIIFIQYLRKHWGTYCEEQAATTAGTSEP